MAILLPTTAHDDDQGNSNPLEVEHVLTSRPEKIPRILGVDEASSMAEAQDAEQVPNPVVDLASTRPTDEDILSYENELRCVQRYS